MCQSLTVCEKYESFFLLIYCLGRQLVEAPRYRPECRGFDSRWGHCDSSLKVLQNGRLVRISKRQTVGERLAGASVTKTATSLAVSRAAASRVMTAHTNQEKTSSAESNSRRKPKLSERNHRTLKRIVSQNHRITAAKVTTELDCHLEGLVSTKAVRREFHKSNIHGRAAITNPLIAESSAKM